MSTPSKLLTLAAAAGLLAAAATSAPATAAPASKQARAACFGLYYAVLLGWLGGWLPDPESRDRELAASLDLFWRGLLTGRS